MDLGIFKRSRAVFSVWLLLPLLTIIALDLSSAGFCFMAKRKLMHNRDMMHTIEDLFRGRERALAAIEAVQAQDGVLPRTSQEISGWINGLAPLSGFTVETLSAVRADGDIPYIRVTLKGRGSYLSLVRFIRSLESQYRLVHVSGIRVWVDGYDRTGTYLCDLAFNVYLVEK